MSFKRYHPGIVDNVEYTKIYCQIYNAICKMIKNNIPFSARTVTAQDISSICSYQCSARMSDELLRKAINAYGSYVKTPLYRGLSKDQRIQALQLKKCKLNHTSSFSTNYDIALNLAGKSNLASREDHVMTVQSCSIKLFDLSYFIKVIEQIVTDFNMDKICNKYNINRRCENWFEALLNGYLYVHKHYPNEELLKYQYDRDVKDFRVNEAITYDEQEWLVPANTILADVDREKLIFKII